MSYAIDLTRSAEESSIVAFLRRVLEREWSTAHARAHEDDPDAGRRLWEHVRDWDVLGDAGLGAMCLVHEELGAALGPGHTWGANLAAAVLRELEHPLADAMASGELRVTVAAPTSLGPELRDDGWVVEPEGADVVLSVEPGAVVLHEEPQTRAASTIDGSRHFAVLVEARRHERASLSRAALDTFWRVGALTAAADSLGACRRLVEASRTYACERRQFGRPVAAFQALAHRIVDMDAAVQIARAALHRAAALVAADAPESAEAVCVAKATTGAAVRSVSRDAVQVHGAIGYTWEHDLHLWARRAYVSDRLFGSGIGYELALARLLA